MSESHPSSEFARFVDVMAPGRACAVAVIETFFDESYDDELLCVAGYIYKKTKAKALDSEMRVLLARKGLPYFRMSACAHGNYPFDRLSAAERDELARAVIALIRKYASVGIATTVDQKAFDSLIPADARAFHGDAYEFCLWSCMMNVASWLDSVNRQSSVAYFFEAGHSHQGRAGVLMERLFKDPELRAKYRYQSHGFIQKECNRPVQTADVLSWHWYQHIGRIAKGKPVRKDFEELSHDRLYIVRHIDVEKHHELVTRLMRDHPLGAFPWQRL